MMSMQDFKRHMGNVGTVVGHGFGKIGHGIARGARAMGSGIVSGAKKIGGGLASMGRGIARGVSGLFAKHYGPATPTPEQMESSRMMGQIGATQVPSRAAEQLPHTPFTPEQIAKMDNTQSGVRGDSSIDASIASVTDPMRREMTDYFTGLEGNGFRYDQGAKGMDSFTMGHLRLQHNDASSAVMRQLFGMLDTHLDRPEMQAMLHEAYPHEVANGPRKMEGAPSKPADMDAKFAKDFLSKGLIPMGSEIRRAVAGGADEHRLNFLKALQSQVAYIDRTSDEDQATLPPDIQQTVSTYLALRNKMVRVGKDGH